jgi:hypothetical protein
MSECAKAAMGWYLDRQKRLEEEKQRLKRWKETLEKLHKIDRALEKLEDLESQTTCFKKRKKEVK